MNALKLLHTCCYNAIVVMFDCISQDPRIESLRGQFMCLSLKYLCGIHLCTPLQCSALVDSAFCSVWDGKTSGD